MEPTEEVSVCSPRGSCSSEKQQHLDMVVSSLLCNCWFVYVLVSLALFLLEELKVSHVVVCSVFMCVWISV